MSAPDPARLPPQVPYIIGNEACERFSFYGMRNILVQFLVSSVILAYLPAEMREGAAKDVFHSFVIGVYFFPLLGGWLADRFFGKYDTVLWFSLIYCAGHACLAMFDDNKNGFYTGLFLIALGSGGIKPLVVSFVGDQFTRDNKALAKVVFDAFYWVINFGSFFASLLMPLFLRSYGPAVAFGIPGVLMGIATFVFWLGRRKYVRVPPTRGQHPDAAVDSVRAVLRILIVFALVTPFWSLFDQKASTWVLQGKTMTIPHEAWWWPSFLVKEAGQMQALNPLLVMLIIPFNNAFLYPALRRAGFEPSALRRMGAGIVFSALAWVVAGMIQLRIDSGAVTSLSLQVWPYLLLTFGEVLVSATALEFAYSQATQSMKGVIMAFWYLTSTFGSLWVLITNAAVRNEAVTSRIASTGLSENAFLMFFFAAFAMATALAFAAYARTYPMQDNYRAA